MPFILEPSTLFYHVERLQYRYSIFLEAMKPDPGHGLDGPVTAVVKRPKLLMQRKSSRNQISCCVTRQK